MLKLFLYCSYSGSAAGYQKAVVDTIAKTVRRDQGDEIPESVSYIWTHSGARAAAGQVGREGYFLAKKIAYLNESRQRDEQGRKVFMNCALVGNRRELELAANGFLACYKAATRALGDLLVIDETDIGYTVQDFEGLEHWFENCIRAGKTAPGRVKVTETPVSFIVLEADWEYFISQCQSASLKGAVCPTKPMSDEFYARLLENSLEEFPISSETSEEDQAKKPEIQEAKKPVPKEAAELRPVKEQVEQPAGVLAQSDAKISEMPEENTELPVSVSDPIEDRTAQEGPKVVVSEENHRLIHDWWPVVLAVALAVFLLWKLFFG